MWIFGSVYIVRLAQGAARRHSQIESACAMERERERGVLCVDLVWAPEWVVNWIDLMIVNSSFACASIELDYCRISCVVVALGFNLHNDWEMISICAQIFSTLQTSQHRLVLQVWPLDWMAVQKLNRATCIHNHLNLITDTNISPLANFYWAEAL